MSAEVEDARFPIGDRTIAYVLHEMDSDRVVVRGPKDERMAALRAFADAEGMVIVPRPS